MAVSKEILISERTLTHNISTSLWKIKIVRMVWSNSKILGHTFWEVITFNTH